MQTTRYIIDGKVQGVGYRRFVLYHAHRLHLRGFVCNLEDGTVECLAQGSIDSLTELEMQLRQGPNYCDVSSVECNDEETKHLYSAFRIT